MVRSRAAAARPLRALLGWLYTGPLGHLAAGVCDWIELLARWGWSRIRER
jgi:hypothetical protein